MIMQRMFLYRDVGLYLSFFYQMSSGVNHQVTVKISLITQQVQAKEYLQENIKNCFEHIYHTVSKSANKYNDLWCTLYAWKSCVW